MSDSKKLNILMVADYFFPDEMGGSKRYIYEISKRLVTKGHNVHVIVKKAKKSLPSEETINGIHIHRYNIISRGIFLSHISYILGALRLFNKLTKKVQFDFINFHHPLSAFGVNLSRKSKGIPKVYTNHSPWIEEVKTSFSSEENGNSFLKKYLKSLLYALMIRESRLIEKYSLYKSNKVIVLSEYNKNLIGNIHNIPSSKIEVIPGGVNTTKFKPAEDRSAAREKLDIPQDKFILLTVRRLVPRMGIENLIKSMPRIIKEVKGISLIIGGIGPSENKLKRLANNLNLENYVKFVGFIPDEELHLYYQATDLFILPTISLEGFGLATVEALSSGTPVLGTPVGGTKEVLGNFDKSLLFNGTDPDSISDLIIDFVNSKSQNQTDELHKKCRDYALKNYSWDVVISKLLDLYRKQIGWSRFYTVLTTEDYLYNVSRHRILLSEIMRQNPKKVIEVGCGSGSMSIFCSHLGISATVVDNNIEVLKKAQENSKRLNANINFILADALKVLPLEDRYDVAFSQGVAEHFTDENIRKYVKNQLSISKKVIISVPSKYYYKSFGDERLLTIEKWKDILQGFNVTRVCHYGVEIPPSWKKFVFKKFVSFRLHHIWRPHHILIEVKR